jgi:broad specificity phosphatase PhoE
MRQRSQPRQLFYVAATVITTIAFMLGSALPAWAAEAMTLTFVRHGESEANAAGVIDTSVPGPHLTELGRQQAVAVAEELAASNYDGIYASSMIRTQETAQPLADRLGQPIVVLPGLREIDAGVFEGQSEDSGLGRIGYVLAPIAWTLGARFVPVLGSTDGNAFDARVDDAVQTIYDSGDRNAVVFSHGATIMFWTMMNVDNPDLGLILSHPLDNTGVVVVTGNPDDGWTLENWDGVAVAAEPSLLTKLFVDVRNVVTAPQTAAYRIGQAFATGDIARIANAIRDGVVDVVTKVVGFVPKVIGDVVESVRGSTPQTLDRPASTNPIPLNRTVSTLTVDPAHERTVAKSAEEPDTTTAVKETGKSNGATDLTDGNKVQPGETATGSGAREQREDDAPQDAGDQTGSVITDITSDTDTDADTDADAEAAPDNGGSEQAAA